MEKKSYAGKITNQGSQKVEAPYKMPTPKAPKVVTGGDLRTGRASK